MKLEGKCNYTCVKEQLKKAYPDLCFAKQESLLEPEIIYFQPFKNRTASVIVREDIESSFCESTESDCDRFKY